MNRFKTLIITIIATLLVSVPVTAFATAGDIFSERTEQLRYDIRLAKCQLKSMRWMQQNDGTWVLRDRSDVRTYRCLTNILSDARLDLQTTLNAQGD